MSIYRIRHYFGIKGRSNHYFHADVVASSGALALKAAREGRVRNWRWIDTFDTAPKDYSRYELLYCVDAKNAKQPRAPQSVKEGG